MTQEPQGTGLTDTECQLKLLLMVAGVVATLMMKMHHHKIPGGDLGEDFIHFAGPLVHQLDPDAFTGSDEELARAKKEIMAMILGSLDPTDEARKFPN